MPDTTPPSPLFQDIHPFEPYGDGHRSVLTIATGAFVLAIDSATLSVAWLLLAFGVAMWIAMGDDVHARA